VEEVVVVVIPPPVEEVVVVVPPPVAPPVEVSGTTLTDPLHATSAKDDTPAMSAVSSFMASQVSIPGESEHAGAGAERDRV
jgi:hypothetical protein